MVSRDTGTVRVDGLNRLVRTMRRAGADLQDFKDAHAKAASIVVSAANSRVPRRSGDLASTIRPAKQARRAIIYAGNARVKYANPIHWGWPARHIRANPFISNAAQQTEPVWTSAYFQELEDIINKIAGA